MTETLELSVSEKAFAKSDKTDAILVVDGKKLNVNKALLSYHSDYFTALFNKKKSMKEIEIKDVKFEDFATLLSLVHDKPLPINSGNAMNLLKLANRFQMHTPKLLVGNFLTISTDFSKIQKLFLADFLNLKELLDHAIGLYNSRKSFRELHSISLFANLSDSTKARLLEKLVKDHGKTL
ncbi:unnamed protein product [Caenorhabditis brenneri]